ncbi:hypothetical protein WJX84_002778 [Apatococcus fuscideae]|uniref:Uncharacterized protein n=1 Tax=Apatococcus fuscideae TaxID=2026836 RepID=A0AAW1T2E4_9CHLO
MRGQVKRSRERAASPVLQRRKTLRSAEADTPAATAKKRRAQKLLSRMSKEDHTVTEQKGGKSHGRAQRLNRTENRPPKASSGHMVVLSGVGAG